MLVKVNVLPNLRNILLSNFDPKGCYDGINPDQTLKYTPGGKPTGSISLNATDYEGFVILCRQVKYKPETEPIDLGGGGAMVAVADLANAIAKTTAETEIVIDAQVA